jgi:hypothetical protein
MDFEHFLGFNTADVLNDRDYLIGIGLTLIVTLLSAIISIYSFIVNESNGKMFLIPMGVGIITTCFIAYKRKKGGYKLW